MLFSSSRRQGKVSDDLLVGHGALFFGVGGLEGAGLKLECLQGVAAHVRCLDEGCRVHTNGDAGYMEADCSTRTQGDASESIGGCQDVTLA